MIAVVMFRKTHHDLENRGLQKQSYVELDNNALC
jgi:hypothetical protein